MKKTSKRIISLFLALVMVAGVCAVGFMVNAAGEEYAYDIGDEIQHAIMTTTDDGPEQVRLEGHTYKEDTAGKFICIDCGHELKLEGSAHEGYVEKKANIAGTCEGFPYDLYRCRECGNEYKVQTGPELGHYWPIKLDEDNISPVYEKKNNNVVMDYERLDNGDPDTDSEQHPWNVPYGEEGQYVTFSYNESNESCTITFKCVRCGESIASYTVTTRRNEIGMIFNVPVEEQSSGAPCAPVAVQKWAEFKIQNTSNSFGSEYFYFHYAIGEESTKPSLTEHDWDNIIWKKDTANPGYHKAICPVCQTVVETGKCDLSSWVDIGESHQRKCSVCDYEETETHKFGEYISNGDGTHTAKCSVCQATDTQNCTNFIYPEHNVAGHKKVCADCGYVAATSEAHDFGSYTDNGDGTHSKTCSLCGQEGEIALHNPSSYVQAGAEGHRAICEDCGASYLEAHEEGEPVINVTVAPTCTEEGKQDVTIYCAKCNFKISEQKDVAVPALGHDFVDGVCTRCGASRSCASEGHEIDEEIGLNFDGVVHYYTCRYCGASVYPDSEGKPVNVTVTINSDGATEVSPNAARHAAQDYYLDDVNELHNFEYCTKCAHKHNFVKTGTITGSCETYSYDTYKCTTCEQKVNVRKGDQLGHYWPIELEDDGLTPKVENGSVVYDEDYVRFRWGAKNES